MSVLQQERALIKLREERQRVFLENLRLEEEINELTRRSLARENAANLGSSEFVASGGPQGGNQAMLPASLNPMFLTELSLAEDHMPVELFASETIARS
jgi:hypothetical protein